MTGSAGTAQSRTNQRSPEPAMHVAGPNGQDCAHDSSTDSTRLYELSDDEATVADILGVNVLGFVGARRARLTRAERHRISQLMAWAERQETNDAR